MLNIRNLKIYNLRFQIQHFRMIILKKMKIINCFLKNNWHTNKTSIIYKIYFFNFYFMSWPHSPGEMSPFIPKIEEVWWVPSQAEWQKGKANPYSLRFHQDNPDMTVSAIRDKVEWVFGLWYEQWEDWIIDYNFNIEYHNPKIVNIKNADKDTFKVLWGWYAKDRYAVYFKWFEIKWINPESFEYLSLPDELASMHNGSWCFWDWENDILIVNGSIVEWVSLKDFGYSQELWLWTDWSIAIRPNDVVNNLRDSEKSWIWIIVKPMKSI